MQWTSSTNREGTTRRFHEFRTFVKARLYSKGANNEGACPLQFFRLPRMTDCPSIIRIWTAKALVDLESTRHEHGANSGDPRRMPRIQSANLRQASNRSKSSYLNITGPIFQTPVFFCVDVNSNDHNSAGIFHPIGGRSLKPIEPPNCGLLSYFCTPREL